MRYARLKPEQTDFFVHLYNRVAGSAGEFPFRDAEKEEFIRRVKKLTQLYVIEVEMNPVRAGMVVNPADYRFCSFGAWSALGRHPFEQTVLSRLFPALKGLLHVETMDEVKVALRKEFARITAVEQRQTHRQIEAAIAVAAEKERFSTRIDRRVRYWVDGLVIGSEIFVRNTLVQAKGRMSQAKRRLVRARNLSHEPEPLYCFRQLRILLQ